MPTTAEAHRVGFKGPHVAHACGAPLGGDIESDTYKRISREAHAARTQHRLHSSGALGRESRDAPWTAAAAPAPAGVAGQAWLDRQDRGGPSTYRRLQASALQPEEREEKQRRNKRGQKKASSSTAAILSGRVSVVSSGSSASSGSSGSSGSTGKRPLWKRALLRGF